MSYLRALGQTYNAMGANGGLAYSPVRIKNVVMINAEKSPDDMFADILSVINRM